MVSRADISLLFDLFVASQRIRRVLAAAMESAGMRADEYAVYSLLFEKGPMTATEMGLQLGLPLSTVLDYVHSMEAAGHLERARHPLDGRAIRVELNAEGLAAQRRAHDSWEVGRRAIEEALPLPIEQVRAALQALDEAALTALGASRTQRARRRR